MGFYQESKTCCKGYAQKYGIDYKETFSPVIRYATICMLLALSVEHDLCLEQLDVCKDYLNSDLHDTFYMQQPQGFVDKYHPGRAL